MAALPGGLTNTNFHVQDDEGLDVVVRWGHADVRMLGIDRDAEHANTAAAYQAGVGAEVVEYRPDLSMLVIGFLSGTALVDADFADAPKQVVMQDQAGGILLPEADKVVSGGRGMKGPENWHLIEDLAKALGAATACSKPVSDVDWRPHHEHVGQTGITVSPNLYIACGISGAIQHLAGVNSSKVTARVWCWMGAQATPTSVAVAEAGTPRREIGGRLPMSCWMVSHALPLLASASFAPRCAQTRCMADEHACEPSAA